MPKKEKLMAEEKLELVQRLERGEIGDCEAGRIAGENMKPIIRWRIRYQSEGTAGFLPRERNRVYSPELKERVVMAYLSGKVSYVKISEEYKISNPCLIEQWVKVYNAHRDFNSAKNSGGGSYMKQGRDTTQERIQIAKDCIASGKNYGEMAQKY